MKAKHDVRIGDRVLVRGVVVPTTQGSTVNCYPGVRFCDGVVAKPLNDLDIVSVEQNFCKGDKVIYDCVAGEIICLTRIVDGPNMAWIKSDNSETFYTADTKNLRRGFNPV